MLKKYQELIKAEASLKGLDEALLLLKEVCAKFINFEKIKSESAKWESNENKLNNYAKIIEAIIEKWVRKNNVWILESNVTKLSPANNKTLIKLSDSEISLKFIPWYINLWQDLVSDEGYSFIMDTTFIVYHNAYFALLPSFDVESAEYGHLIKIFLEYSTHLNNPEDVYQIKAMAFEAQNKYNLAKEYYYKSLLSTSSDDPSFPASLQDYWSFLVEKKNVDEALDMLLNIKYEKLIKDTEFYDGLIRSTFRIAGGKKKLQTA
ncbi:MAG: hypothetical protein L0Y79_02610 [Chlorobi bacterium]|nr:hypothetical protein [Chlorobiota bacterium]